MVFDQGNNTQGGKTMFYTKPVLTAMSLTQSEAVAATPWETYTKGGTVVDGATSSFDAQLSGTYVSGGNA